MLVVGGDLGNEVGPDGPSGAAYFSRDGWVVGRGVLSTEIIHEVRRPIVDLLRQHHLIECRTEDPARFRWAGPAAAVSERDFAAAQANAPLVRPGHARLAVERLWGRPAALWTNTGVFLSLPEHASPAEAEGGHAHRDGWQPLGYGS